MGSKTHHTDKYRVDELQEFTKNYEHKLGEGAFGVVYKGTCKDGKLIAVKVLKERPAENQQEEFKRELENLKTVTHPNIIELVGFCYQVGSLNTITGVHQIGAALCFEFATNGSLKPYISGDTLDWRTRYGIIKGTCEGLKYLYHDHPSGIILHRDLKPDNILLDDHMIPKIADFGLSKLCNDQITTVTNNHAATPRYAPPEFRNRARLSKTFDMYSLGVIIMEIVAGPDAYDEIDEMSHQQAIELVRKKWRDRVDEMRLYQIITCLELAIKCAHLQSKQRPGIKFVLEKLNEVEKMVPEEKTTNNQGREEIVKYKQGKKEHVRVGKLDNTLDKLEIESHRKDIVPIAFVFEQIEKITENFSQLIGHGSYGKVYKGIYEDGKEAAVKVFHPSAVNMKVDFKRELENLTRLSHENIIKLVGYCFEVSHKYNNLTKKPEAMLMDTALCFEYASRGSLQSYITDQGDGLDWKTCYKIIRGTCEGLNHLHNHPSNPMYHLDLKPENILLTDTMVPKIADFGLSRIFGDQNTQVTLNAVGTWKYAPIEFKNRAIITSKHDIYSLGIIIIDIVAGSNTEDLDNSELIVHVLQKWSGRVENTLLGQVKTCFEIALRCVRYDRHERPTVSQIIDELNEVENMILQEACHMKIGVRPSRLWFPFERNKTISCSLELSNKGQDHVGFKLLANTTRRYLTKLPLIGILPPVCTYVLTVTIRKQAQQPEDIGEFFTLQSIVLDDEDLQDVQQGSSARQYENFFNNAKGKDVQEVVLPITCDPSLAEAEGTSSSEPIHSTVEIITTTNALGISSIDVQPTEQWIMTMHKGGSLRVWNYKTMVPLDSFKALSEYPVNVAKFIGREKWVVTGDSDGDIHVYCYDQHEEMHSFPAHDSPIVSLAVHPSLPYVLSSSEEDNLIKLWDWNKEWGCIRTFQSHTDGVTQVTFNQEEIDCFASTSLDGTLKIWNVHSDEIITLNRDLEKEMLCVNYFTRNDGQHLITCSKDGNTQLFYTGKHAQEGCLAKLEGEVNFISTVYCHPELRVLITGSDDGTVRTWNSTTCKLESVICLNLGAVHALGFIKDLNRMVVGCHQGIATVEIPCIDISGQGES